MAQGEQRRLARLGHAKQLLHVGAGERIICRTKRLVLEAAPWARVTVVGRWRDFAVVPGLPPIVELDDPGHCVLDGMAGALVELREAPRGPWVVLLGDVVWSRAALHGLLQDERPVVFSGTRLLNGSQGEVFGCRFADRDALAFELARAPCRFRSIDRQPLRFPAGQQGGHLRRLLFHVQGRAPSGLSWWLP